MLSHCEPCLDARHYRCRIVGCVCSVCGRSRAAISSPRPKVRGPDRQPRVRGETRAPYPRGDGHGGTTVVSEVDAAAIREARSSGLSWPKVSAATGYSEWVVRRVCGAVGSRLDNSE